MTVRLTEIILIVLRDNLYAICPYEFEEQWAYGYCAIYCLTGKQPVTHAPYDILFEKGEEFKFYSDFVEQKIKYYGILYPKIISIDDFNEEKYNSVVMSSSYNR